MQTLKAKKLDGTDLTLNHGSVEAFKNQLRGALLVPGDEGYEAGRVIYNAMIQKKPGLIVRCRNAGDVISAVNFARENELLLAIRSGGHNGPGLGTCEGGLVIDLSGMKGIRVDPESKTVHAEPGNTWGDLDHAASAFGLAVPSGVISTTGIGGLTLGGGHGYLSRKHGLTIDNLISADVVLADGSFVHATEKENSDLFWALRGGGGNFGAITSFEYQLHPVDKVIAGPLFWPIDQLETTMRWYREWLPAMPDDVYAFYLIAEIPAGEPFPEEIQGEKACGLIWCYTGPEEEFEEVIQQARDVAEPLFEHTGPMPYPVLQSLFDGLLPPGHQWYWKGDFVHELTDDAIAEHARFAEVPTPQSTMHLYPINGAVHRMDEKETAWAYRDANWSMVIAGIDPDPQNNDKMIKWANDYWEAVHPHNKGGAYINFMMKEGEDRIKSTYGDNYDRLVEIKTKYDPGNLFRVNQNIKPMDRGAKSSYKDPSIKKRQPKKI